MATISDIARAADVSVESVLRVLNRDPVSEDVRARVTAAMGALHFHPVAQHAAPDEPESIQETAAPGVETGAEVIAETTSGRFADPPQTLVARPSETDLTPAILGPSTPEPRSTEATIERVREQLVQALAHATAELEATLPRGVSAVLYEALRVEVRPVAERMGVIDEVFARLADDLDGLQSELRSERSDRLSDLALLVDLVTTSWRTVDGRLARIERKLDRLEQRDSPRRPMRALTLDDGDSRRLG